MEIDKSNTSFNMALSYYISLIKIMEEKDQAAIQGDLPGWMRGLKIIQRRISFKLRKKEYKERKEIILDKLEAARKLLKSHIPNNDQQKIQILAIIQEKVWKLLDDVEEEIWYILDKEDMIFPNIKIQGGLGTLLEKMNLGDKKK